MLLLLGGAVVIYNMMADRMLQNGLNGLEPPPYILEPRYSVSVITPAYNEEKYIERCLISVQNQTEPVVEHIVTDCSDDSTPEIARGYGAHVLTVPSGNLSGSRNQGARLAKGEILVFLDADSILAPNGIEGFVDTLENGAFLAHPRIHSFYDSWTYNKMFWGPQAIFRPRLWLNGGCEAMPTNKFWEIGGWSSECTGIVSVGGESDCFEGPELGRRVEARWPGSVRFAPVRVATSARRFKQFGIWGSRNSTPVRSVIVAD